ncbi:acyltransferase family protein [Massilia putida]|uniref:acyltransferase family protein n=1 Tax=Massilia putida TaxID=1141883 RepID=UPI0009529609|nr:acyltransferase [Massilia putida]
MINLLKAGAAQLIVLHHLAFYGPMADAARPLMPSLIDWLDHNGRIAVQAFLVMSGFLVAKSLSPSGLPGIGNPLGTIWRRYIKLAPPFIVAMFLAIGASALARTWMVHDSISAPPNLSQLAAHVFLLQSVLGYESLSAGAWYVAIDFQLYALITGLLWLGGRIAGNRRTAWLMPLLVTLGVSISLLYVNRDAGFDVWAPYFFGSYGLGVLAWWAGDPRRPFVATFALLLMMIVPTVLALGLDFRIRIAVAAAVACVLFLFGRTRLSTYANSGWSVVNYLGKISYSIFLVHFPVCLVVNAAFTRFVPDDAYLQRGGCRVGVGGQRGVRGGVLSLGRSAAGPFPGRVGEAGRGPAVRRQAREIARLERKSALDC